MNEQMAVTELDKGNQFLQEGKLEDAIAAYRLAIELNPDYSWSHHNLGEALAKVCQFEAAIAAFRRAIELKPDFSWSYHHLGDALAQQEQWEESVIAFRKAIELNPQHFGTYVGLGNCLSKMDRLDEAIAAYRRASELEPEADWIQYRLGELLQQRTQLDLEGAIASYRRAIELNPHDVESYRKLLKIQPDNLEVWLNLGKALVKQELWEEAIASYRRITELNPDDVQAHYRLGELLIKHGDLDGAIDTLRHALELSPNSDESYYNLGEALAAQGNATEASLCYYKAFKLNPNNMQASQKCPRIYDCFAFFNELDVLRIRIEELKDVVNKFILVEATKTFSGNPKPLYYQEFSHEFTEYHDKIIHYVVDDMPEIDYSQPVHLQAWPLDVHQKNCISRVLNSIDCKDEDIILVNDCDEIPRKEKLSEAIELLKDNEFVIFVQDLYHGHLDNLYSEWWCGTVACKYKDFKVRTYTKVRYSDKINTGLDMGDPTYKRSGYINSNQYFEHPYLLKSGWSFSWFGSELSRRYKLQSFAHKEGDDSEARKIEKIKYDVCRPSLEMESSGEFYFDARDIEGKDVPEFLSKNILKYRHFLQPRQTELMGKIGGDFKQVETQIDLLKNEAIKVKLQLEKGIQNLLKVCDTLAERGNLVEAIAQWRQLVELYPEFTSKKCFLSNLDGIKTFQINPEDYTLISGQVVQTPNGQQLVSQTGNYGQICYGPYVSLPDGLYKVKINVESSDFYGIKDGINSGKAWFKFDVAVNKGLVIYEENVYNNNQVEHEFFIDVNAKDLELRFWATGLFFAVNFIELKLIYQTDFQIFTEIYKQNHWIRKIDKIEVRDDRDYYGQFIYAEWNHPYERTRDWAKDSLYLIKTERWGEYILPGTIAIDIGAHTGDTALPMAILTGSTGMVLAFEPNPHVYKVLEVNQSLNKDEMNIEIFDAAIMANEGIYDFTYGDSECCNGGYDDLLEWNTTNPDVTVIPVKGVNLVTFLQSRFGQEYDRVIKRLSFIKIDCEGYDKEVIKTIKPIIDVAKPALFVEWFINFNQEQTDDLFQSIHNLGYSCYNPITLELQEGDVNKKIPDILCLPNPSLETQNRSNFIDVRDKGEICDGIWEVINQPEILKEDTQNSPIEISQEYAYEHFAQTSSYKIINLFSLTDEDKFFLLEKGLSINSLELIAKEDKEQENRYINYFVGGLNNHENYPVAIHQNSLLTTGYIYTLSPFSDSILRSNHSFLVNYWEIGHHDLQAFCYRFSGEKIFYLIIGGMGNEKTGLYIPELDLIIIFVAAMQTAKLDKTINKLKSYMVSYFQPVKSYILNTHSKPLVNQIGLFFNIGHYVWNELGGICIINHHEPMQKVVNNFLIGAGDYFGAMDIFPEIIHTNNVIQVKDAFDAFKAIVNNNYLALRIVGSYMKQELIHKIIQVSLTKCSPNFLEQVKAAKEKCFPIIGLQFRTGSRVWSSQVEGLANIVNKLYEEFPNLGVVFDGWSSIPGQEYSSDVTSVNIQRDKAVEEQIKNLIPSGIPIYSAIGATTYETVIWWHQAIDTGIEPLSGGLLFSSWIADKPGVIHSRSDLYHTWVQAFTTAYCRENLVGSKIFVGSHQDSPGDYNSNYECDWEVIYNEALKLIKNLTQERE
ncbi:MAG: FkbM family methyltransferase [Microcoleus sp.]